MSLSRRPCRKTPKSAGFCGAVRFIGDMLLVKPAANVVTVPGYYANNDVSVHQQGGSFSNSADPYGAGAGFAKALR